MVLIYCLDPKNGMTFNNRRQSMDKAVRERIGEISSKNRLLMNIYSSKQFTEQFSNIQIDENFLNYALENDYCFVENLNTKDYIKKTDKIIIYRWDKVYPSDFKLDYEPKDYGFKLYSSYEFKGNSHDIIVEETYNK